jgi:hypothetical protein
LELKRDLEFAVLRRYPAHHEIAALLTQREMGRNLARNNGLVVRSGALRLPRRRGAGR